MTPQRWSRIREVFGAALESPQSERLRFLDSACGHDVELRAEVEQLLAANQEASLQSPVAAFFSVRSELKPGDTVAQYRIDATLGEGGMGRVYKSFDTRLHREVALKLLSPEHLVDPEHKQRLMREARAASGLNHPNIVTVYEIGSQDDVDFIAMEYVEGESLARAIPPAGLPLELAVSHAIEIASALAKAHGAGVIHRDLKPANMMVTAEGHIKLLDFGLACRAPLAESGTVMLSGEGEISGTVGYMSPEQVRGVPVDNRTDIFSFGVVLYEMVTGERPFTGGSAMAVCDAILHLPPREFNDNKLPVKLKAIIRKMLDKDPANRYASAEQVQQELKVLVPSLLPTASLRMSRKSWLVAGVTVVLVGIVAGRFWHESSRERWALGIASPEIARLVDAGDYGKAAALAREARAVLPNDPTLENLWIRATGEISIETVPRGAELSIRPYRGDPRSWNAIGKTPLQKFRLPPEVYVWRIVKPGFAPMFFIAHVPGASAPGYHPNNKLTFRLRSERNLPPEMVIVNGGMVFLPYPLSEAPGAQVEDFLIDRHEVTNEEYKKFVGAGGYQKREFWKEPFIRGGRTVSWESAMSAFHDATGHPGPSTWELGDFPKGREKYPVAGVSWYEANAYASSIGKSLPTAYHWMQASQSMRYTPQITPGSNFRGEGTQPVGSASAFSGFGTTDMAGNVKEWVWNQTGDAKRLILGGGFGEPEYMFNYTDAQSPWDRRSNFGFRCVKLDAEPSAASMARLEVTARNYWKEKPISEEAFKAYTAHYTYDKGDLNAQLENTEPMEEWTREKITFDAAYGNERVTAYLFVPKNASPPFQAVVYFPGGFAFMDDRLDVAGLEETRGFLMKSGRALIVPIYKGTYERRDGFTGASHMPPAFRRDHQVAWSKDLGRTLDYLETRKDIDSTKIAYLGDSAGGPAGALLLAIEKRIKTAIVSSGGLQLSIQYAPDADPFNFVGHVTIPVLMLNGRYDSSFPLESSQRALFQFLGTPAKDKKHVIYDAGHGAFPRPTAVRECLDWLDKYLGPVRH